MKRLLFAQTFPPYPLLLLLLMIIVMAACRRDPLRGIRTNIMVVNASSTTQSVQILQNLQPLATTPYLNGLTAAPGYVLADSGLNNYQLRVAESILASWIYGNMAQYQTLFVYEPAVTGQVKYFFLSELLDTAGLRRQSRIRLVHLSPDLDTIDLLTNRLQNPLADSVLIDNRAYAAGRSSADLSETGNFLNFFGDTTATISLRKKSTQTKVKTYRLPFAKGGIYSLVVKGYAGRGGADSLSLTMIRHN